MAARRGPSHAEAFAGELQRSLAVRAARQFPTEHDPNFQLLQRALEYLHDRGGSKGWGGELGKRRSREEVASRLPDAACLTRLSPLGNPASTLGAVPPRSAPELFVSLTQSAFLKQAEAVLGGAGKGALSRAGAFRQAAPVGALCFSW